VKESSSACELILDMRTILDYDMIVFELRLLLGAQTRIIGADVDVGLACHRLSGTSWNAVDGERRYEGV